jgi:hypothetical protein
MNILYILIFFKSDLFKNRDRRQMPDLSPSPDSAHDSSHFIFKERDHNIRSIRVLVWCTDRAVKGTGIITFTKFLFTMWNVENCPCSLHGYRYNVWVYISVSILQPFLLELRRSRDSSVGIATGYGLDDRGVGVRVPVGSSIFSSPRRPDRLWCPPILLSNWYRGLFSLGVKLPGREADHSPPASAEVKKMWLYTSTPPYAFMA